MAINLPIPGKKEANTALTTGSSATAGPEEQAENSRASTEGNNPQDLLVKASRDAELAKSAVRHAIHQAFIKREDSLKKAEALAPAFEEAIQELGAPAGLPASGNTTSGPLPDSLDPVHKGLVKKILNGSSVPPGPLSDIIKVYFRSKLDTEVKKNTTNPSVNQGQNPSRTIDQITDDQARKKASTMIGDAKSDRLASRLVVVQAQEEIKKAREEAALIKQAAEDEARRAREEAEFSRKDAEEAINLARGWIEQAKTEAAAEKKAAEMMASQARQQALSQATEEIKKAKEEVRGAKEAASTAIRMAKDEVSRVHEEAENYKKNAQAAIAALEEKVMKVVEKVQAIKQQSLISISEAQAEAQRAREEAETTRRNCETAVKQAEMESQKAMEEARLEMMKAQETVIKAEQHAYEQVREKMEQVKAEADITKQTARDAVARAQEEARKAREDAEIVKKASEDAVLRAIEERRKSEDEAEQARRTMLEFANRAQEDSRQAREEAETAIMRANDAMIKAQQDIIGMTINEISATRQELEESVNNPDKLDAMPSVEAARARTENLDPEVMTTVLNEMRTPLHSISGFARLMLDDDDTTDSATRKEFLSIVIQQSEALSQILNELAGKLESDDEPPAADAPEVSAF